MHAELAELRSYEKCRVFATEKAYDGFKIAIARSIGRRRLEHKQLLGMTQLAEDFEVEQSMLVFVTLLID